MSLYVSSIHTPLTASDRNADGLSVDASGFVGHDQLDAAAPCSQLNGCQPQPVNGYLVR